MMFLNAKMMFLNATPGPQKCGNCETAIDVAGENETVCPMCCAIFVVAPATTKLVPVTFMIHTWAYVGADWDDETQRRIVETNTCGSNVIAQEARVSDAGADPCGRCEQMYGHVDFDSLRKAGLR